MKGHVIVHTGEKPYSCSQWVKSFAHASNLKKRVRIHTGGRPYSCSQCIKLFLHVGDVKKRVRIHNGEKPYSCSHCTKNYFHKQAIFSEASASLWCGGGRGAGPTLRFSQKRKTSYAVLEDLVSRMTWCIPNN